MKINILGTNYSIIFSHRDTNVDLENNDGVCDETVKQITVENYKGEDGKPGIKKDLDVQRKKNVRHEIVHAFLFECGLAENSSWAQNEEMVDWIAIQGPKLYKKWEEAGAL